MAKRVLTETRFDFRKGRNTAISPDLLNNDELVDLTNGRLTNQYGAFTKRGGTQRMHPDSFPQPIRGVYQWDAPGGKQVVVISDGKLYFRDGYNFGTPFTQATTASVARSTAGIANASWFNQPSNTLSGIVINAAAVEVAAGSRLRNEVGDPTFGTNDVAADGKYTFSFKLTADGTGFSGTYVALTVDCYAEVNIDGAGFTDYGFIARTTASIGVSNTQTHGATLTVGVTSSLEIRLKMVAVAVGSGSGTGVATITVLNTSSNFPVTWVTGAAGFSLTDPAIFQPFRSATSNALLLFIASGGHYFSWDGVNITTGLVQLDPTNSAPLTTAIISYHTRMFAITASPTIASATPKTIFWSKIGDATIFTTGDKTMGGSAITDFLTGQRLTALEVIGSSLLMATADSIMRFQGHSSEDIVIQQDTEGISADVGVVGVQALRRFENVAAFLALRGPYVATETAIIPSGEQVLPDFDALDSTNLSKAVVHYNHGRKDLWFAVPGAGDSGLNKTVFTQAVRLQAWQGPWLYSFGINCMAQYVHNSGIENIIAGCSDGYVRLMDTGKKDDVLYDGTSGSNITMTAEIPTMQYGAPGHTKQFTGVALQATLPASSDLKIKQAFDGASLATTSVVSTGATEKNYRVDMSSQGKRQRMVFEDASGEQPIINGFIAEAYDYGRA